jgi:hypothetical protein
MSLDYVLWEKPLIEHGVVLRGLKGVKNEWELNEGVPRASTPMDAEFHMDPERPHDTVLADSVGNIDMLIVASERLTNFLRARALADVEYLPAKIVDHKGKSIPTPYFIVHPINPVDCLDAQRCGVTWDSLDPEYIDRLERLAMKESFERDALEGAFTRALFRPRLYYRVTLVRRDLATAMDEAGFTGLRWLELEDHPRPRRRRK